MDGPGATVMSTSQPLRPGERLFALVLVLFAGFVFSESYAISGFKGLTTGGVMPMLASGIMVITGLLILAETFRKPRAPEAGVFALVAYLFPLRVVLFSLLVVAYASLIPSLGFLLASALLLFVAIWALWQKGPIWAFAISLVSVAAIYVLFRIVFQVVLPIGSLWR